MESMLHKWFLAIHRSRHGFLRERFGHLDVEPRLLPLPCRLYGADGLRQEDLSAESGLDKSTIAHGVKRLSDLGYVTREPCPGDRRSYHLSLTEKANALVPTVDAAMREWGESLVADFSADEVRALHGYLGRMADNAAGRVRPGPHNRT